MKVHAPEFMFIPSSPLFMFVASRDNGRRLLKSHESA